MQQRGAKTEGTRLCRGFFAEALVSKLPDAFWLKCEPAFANKVGKTGEDGGFEPKLAPNKALK